MPFLWGARFLKKKHTSGGINFTQSGRVIGSFDPMVDDGEIICKKCGRVIMLTDPNEVRFEKNVEPFCKVEKWEISDTGPGGEQGEILEFSELYTSSLDFEVDQKICDLAYRQDEVDRIINGSEAKIDGTLAGVMILSFTLGVYLLLHN